MSQPRRTVVAVLAGSLAATLSVLASTTPAAQGAPEPCFSAGTLDLNGDGHTDAVVGDPYATVQGQAAAGRVVVL